MEDNNKNKRKVGRPKKGDEIIMLPENGVYPLDRVEEQYENLTPSKKQVYVNDVIKLMMEGKTTMAICQEYYNKYKFSERKTKYLIASANKAITEYTTEERLILKEKNQALLQDLYQKNMDRGDYKEARTILEVLNKMFGLNAADKLEISKSIIHFEFDLSDTSTKDEIQDTTYINLTSKQDENINGTDNAEDYTDEDFDGSTTTDIPEE